MKYLIFDMSNILYRNYFGNPNITGEHKGVLALHAALVTLNSFYKKFKPDKMVAVFDKGKSWRKDYTESDKCISKKIYKGNRRKNMTQSEYQKYLEFLEHTREFENLLRDNTTMICLAHENLEADDLIAGFTQAFDGDEMTIISRDRDFLQLVDDKVKLFDPQSAKYVTLKEWNNDREWFMFVKCIRGDQGDNVQSSKPGIHMSKLKQIYPEPFLRLNLMEDTWINPIDERVMKVKDLFKEGQLLMDLTKQPNKVRKQIFNTILEGIDNPGKFNWVLFLQFLGKHNLDEISNRVDDYVSMLSA